MARQPVEIEDSDIAVDAHDQSVAVWVTTDWDMGYGLLTLSESVDSIGIYLTASQMRDVARALNNEAANLEVTNG